jgi:hypothetical protein
MSDQDKEDRLRKAAADYQADSHGMQSGVATEIAQLGLKEAAADPKYLRTGVNAAMVDVSALAQLLIEKGLITEVEYLEALAKGMRAERQNYEKRLSDKLGVRITLG